MQRILAAPAPTRRVTAWVIIVVFLAAFAADARATISTVTLRGPQKISAGTQFSREPQIASNGSNRFVAVWADRSSADGIYSSDLRLGAWIRPSLIPGSQDGEEPAVAMAPNGATIVAWPVQHGDPHSGQIGVSYRSPSGSFSPAKYLGVKTNGATNDDITLAINSTGRSVITWTHTDDGRSVQAAFGAGATFGAVQTLDSGASDPSVALDGAGRAIVLYAQADRAVRQALAPAGGTFGAATTIDQGYDENSTSNQIRVATNSSGSVAGGWGGVCGAPDCDNIFFAKMSIGSTAAGITEIRQVSNPGGGPAGTGPDRKHDDVTEVAVDEAGNATMIWDASDSSFAGYDFWAVHHTAAGYSDAASFGTSTEAVDNELQLVAADGHVVVSWVNAPAAGQPSLLYMTQVDVPASGPATWPTPVVASTAGASADSLDSALSAGGQFALVYRVADRIWSNTNAPRDTSKPTITVMGNGQLLKATSGTAAWRTTCPNTEAACGGNVTATMRVNGRAVPAASGTYYVLGGRSGLASLRLNRAARTKLAMTGRLAVVITTTVRDAAGNAGPNVVRTATFMRPIA